MVNNSPYVLAKQLEGDIIRLLAHIDTADLNTKEQHTLAQLKNGLIDARLEIQDYELAETREDQLRNAKIAKKYLQNVEKLMVANPTGVFGPVDVAHLTAYIGQITDRLK